jgi:hypothetical protein
MSANPELLRVPLDSVFAMHLRPSELESVALGLRQTDASASSDYLSLAAALHNLPPSDRAPLWELAVRRYGRSKPLAQASAEIGMDLVHARELLEAFSRSRLEVASKS